MPCPSCLSGRIWSRTAGASASLLSPLREEGSSPLPQSTVESAPQVVGREIGAKAQRESCCDATKVVHGHWWGYDGSESTLQPAIISSSDGNVERHDGKDTGNGWEETDGGGRDWEQVLVRF